MDSLSPSKGSSLDPPLALLAIGGGGGIALFAAAVAGHTALASGTTSVGKFYTAADTIDLIANTATFDGKVRVFAVIAELGTAETAASFA